MGDIKGFLKVKRETTKYRLVCERKNDYCEVSNIPEEKHSQEQASRCMDCGTPFCHWGCPIGNYIPEWNDAVFSGHWEKAFLLLNATNNLPEITGRICPAPCEYSCVLSINDDAVTIRENELAIIEYAFKKGLVKPHPPKKRTGKRVAVIGSGPAGLSCAAGLNQAGHHVEVFEKDDKIGGILRYGIPDFKLEKQVLDRRLKILEKEGIEFRRGFNIGVNYSVTKLKKEFHAICLAGGSGLPRDLKIEGRQLRGIYFAMDYLTQANKRVAGEKFPGDKLIDGSTPLTIDPERASLDFARDRPERTPVSRRTKRVEWIDAKDKRVVIIGAGDTGADCLGVAHRQGASSVVQIELLPQPPQCRTIEFPWPTYPMLLKTSSSHEEGGSREWSVLTKSFIGEKGQVKKLCCLRVEFEKDTAGCPIIKEIKGSDFEIEADLVILALGFLHPQKEGLIEVLGVELDSRCNVKTAPNFMTSKRGVFACGDMRRGQSLIVWAIAEGRTSSHYIDKYLMGYTNLPLI